MTTGIDWGRIMFSNPRTGRKTSLRHGVTVSASANGYVDVLLDGSNEPVTLACSGYLQNGKAVSVMYDGGSYKIMGDGGTSGSGGGGGFTFYPSVSEDGVISWSNDGGFDNPEPVNIKGEAGIYYGSEEPEGDPPPVWIDPNGVTSDDINMPGAIVEETDPTVPDWAKQPEPPKMGEAEKQALIAEITDKLLYTDLSYIQCDAKAYILTDFIPTSKTRITLRGFFPLGSSAKAIFGAMTSTSSNRFDLGSSSSSKYQIGYGTTYKASSLAELKEPFDMDMNRNVLYINGEEAASIAESEWQGAYPLAIFARNVKGTVGAIINAGSQIEWMKIYEDDVLVRDFIPRKHLTEGCGLYDRLSGKFWGNAATSGAFTGA